MIVDLLIANEPGPEEIVRGTDDWAKDKARGVELSSSPLGLSGDSSQDEIAKGKVEPGWFSVICIQGYQMSLFNKYDKNRFWSFVSLKEMGDERMRIACETSFTRENEYIPGSFWRLDLRDQQGEKNEQWSLRLTIRMGELVGEKE